MDNTTATSTEMVAPLEVVLLTEELERRPSRPADYETERRALVSLVQALAASPRTILQTLANTILEVFEADSAGVSLMTEDGQRFYWPAIAGVWKPHIGGGTPRDFGPCGDVLDLDCPLLFTHPERRYTYFQLVTPPVEECLLVPFYVEGKAVGTIWAIMHDEHRKFDSEDRRMLLSVGSFASAAYQVAEKIRALTEHDFERHNSAQTMRDMNEALLISSLRQHELAEQGQLAEQRLQDSEVRYRRLFETTTDGVLILDFTSGKIVAVNPSMKKLLGDLHGDFSGKELWEIGLFPDAAANAEAVRQLQEGGYVRYENITLEPQHGERVDVEIIANVYSEGQHPVIQCNIRDITERRRLEQQTHDQGEALAELHLRKDEFLAMLSHELRNPLSAIFNALHILRLQDAENPIQAKAKGVIERQVGQMAHLIDDLLEVSRVITGGIKLHQEQLEMRGIVDRAIESTRPMLDARKHELLVELPDEPIWLEGDPTRLEQVVVNLLNNAAKYTDEGGQIRLTAGQEGPEIVLRVCDNGIGISPTLLPRIFDLFTQADRTLDRSQGGLGIGLSLVEKLVKLHGGTVAAYSPGLGQGSEFVVRLPALTSVNEVIDFIEPFPLAEKASRILVIDDNRDSADMLSMMLQMFGHEVQTAYSGQGALEKLNDFLPSVVLLDIGLPDISGYDVARRLRQLPQGKAVTLIAMTGYGQDSDRQLSHEAGFDHHMVKPVEPQRLQDLLVSL